MIFSFTTGFMFNLLVYGSCISSVYTAFTGALFMLQKALFLHVKQTREIYRRAYKVSGCPKPDTVPAVLLQCHHLSTMEPTL